MYALLFMVLLLASNYFTPPVIYNICRRQVSGTIFIVMFFASFLIVPFIGVFFGTLPYAIELMVPIGACLIIWAMCLPHAHRLRGIFHPEQYPRQ